MSRTTAIVALGFALLVALTTTLASFYHGERTSRASRHFTRGEALRAEGDLEAAALELRTALSLARDRHDYQLALGLTLLQAGHTREAVSYLDEVLQSDPTNGIANRARADAARRLDIPSEVPTYYRRAIYGVWPPESADLRLATRFAFIEFLLQRGQRAEALGELGELAAELPADSAERVHIASLLLSASAPDQAAEILRASVQVSPDDPRVWQRLAEAEFALGSYRAAASAAKRALAIGPADSATATRLELAEAVIALDPSAPRLPTSERRRRSRDLLGRAMAALDACIGEREGPDRPEIADLKRAASEQLATRRSARTEQAIDASIGVAELAWRSTRQMCPSVPADEAAVELVMRKLAKEGSGS